MRKRWTLLSKENNKRTGIEETEDNDEYWISIFEDQCWLETREAGREFLKWEV